MNLTGGKEEIQLIYEPNVKKEDLKKQLFQGRDRDLKFKLSSVGPNRDDFCIRVNGIDIRRFGSQGQQRSAALSLKLSLIHISSLQDRQEARKCLPEKRRRSGTPVRCSSGGRYSAFASPQSSGFLPDRNQYAPVFSSLPFS